MQLENVRSRRPTRRVVLDDTVGNPRTLFAVFESIAAIPHLCLRSCSGSGGPAAPDQWPAGTAVAALVTERARRVPVRLVVTASIDTAEPRDRVGGSEGEAVLTPLRAGRWPSSTSRH